MPAGSCLLPVARRVSLLRCTPPGRQALTSPWRQSASPLRRPTRTAPRPYRRRRPSAARRPAPARQRRKPMRRPAGRRRPRLPGGGAPSAKASGNRARPPTISSRAGARLGREQLATRFTEMEERPGGVLSAAPDGQAGSTTSPTPARVRKWRLHSIQRPGCPAGEWPGYQERLGAGLNADWLVFTAVKIADPAGPYGADDTEKLESTVTPGRAAFAAAWRGSCQVLAMTALACLRHPTATWPPESAARCPRCASRPTRSPDRPGRPPGS